MKRILTWNMMAGALLTFLTATARAEEPVLRLPFISIDKGTVWEGVHVRFPTVQRETRKVTRQQPGGPPPLPMEPAPVPPEMLRQSPAPMMPPGSGPVVVQAMYHKDFAKAFTPMAGTHRVMLIHPYTCCPVEVCFNLPCGCPKVKCDRNEIEFDYGRQEVEIRFCRCGDVKVKYRNGCGLLSCLR